MIRLTCLALLAGTLGPAAAFAQSATTAPAGTTEAAPQATTDAPTSASPAGTTAASAPASVNLTTYVTGQPEGALFASDLVGYPVYGREGEKIGDINDVVIGADASVAAVVIGVGGFLGLGEKDVAVPLSSLSLSFVDQRYRISLDATEQQLLEAPVFVRADGTTSDRLGAFQRSFERTRIDASKALDTASEQAGQLTDQAGTEARRLLDQGREAVRSLRSDDSAPAEQPADGTASQ